MIIKNTRSLALIALSIALTAVLSQLTLPLGPIPLTLQTFSLALISSLLTPRDAGLSFVGYLLLGGLGLPVFAGGGSGFGILFGPNGGYLLSFVPLAYLSAWLLQKLGHRIVTVLTVTHLAALINLLIGSIWLSLYLHQPFFKSLIIGFFPFALPGIIKAVLASLLADRLYPALMKLPYFK